MSLCIKCQYMGSNFKYETFGNDCYIIVCPKCNQDSLIFNCGKCDTNIHLDRSHLDNSKVFQCPFDKETYYRLTKCFNCGQMQKNMQETKFTQDLPIKCHNCNQVSTYMNCPLCEHVVSIKGILNSNSAIKCQFCSQEFYYVKCETIDCAGECFATKNNQEPLIFICNKDPKHSFTIFGCEYCNTSQFLTGFSDFKESHNVLCKHCKMPSTIVHCISCHHKLLQLSPQIKNMAYKDVTCQQCQSKQILIPCDDCKIGILVLPDSWYSYVRANMENTPTPFTMIQCLNCKKKSTLIICRHCDNSVLFREKEDMKKCNGCNRPYARNAVENVPDMDCTLCFSAQRNSAFLECGHVSSCYECAIKSLTMSNKKSQCPTCRIPITKVIKLFYS